MGLVRASSSMAFSSRLPTMEVHSVSVSSRSSGRHRLSGVTVRQMPYSAACIIFPMTRAQMEDTRMQSAVSRMAWLETRLLFMMRCLAWSICPDWR